jgi:hypothetical protein
MDSTFQPPFMQNNGSAPTSNGASTGKSTFPAPLSIEEENLSPMSKTMPESDLTKKTFSSSSSGMGQDDKTQILNTKITQVTRKIEELELIQKQKEEANQVFENNLKISKELKENFILSVQNSALKSDLKDKITQDIDQIFAKNIQELNESPGNIQKRIETLTTDIEKELDSEIVPETKNIDPKLVLPLLFALFISITESSSAVAQKVLKVILPVFEKYLNGVEVPEIALLKQIIPFLERVGKLDPKGLRTQGPIIIQNLYGKLLDNKLSLVEEGKLAMDDQKKAVLTVAKRLVANLSQDDSVEMYKSILTAIEGALK